jgi:hypothetical protein
MSVLPSRKVLEDRVASGSWVVPLTAPSPFTFYRSHYQTLDLPVPYAPFSVPQNSVSDGIHHHSPKKLKRALT